MKAPVFTCLLALTTLAVAGEMKTFTIKSDDWAEGEVPKEVFVVDGTVKITAKDGNKAIMIGGTPIVDASAQLAVSAAGESSIQAKVFASKRGRSVPKFGISVHGMSGYRLLINAAKKQLELVKGEAVTASVPYTWTSETWVQMKLEVKRGVGDAWVITGKAWAADASEPAEPSIKHADKDLKGQGKAGVWATPYAETPIYFDDIEVKIEVAPAT
ncbi:MAG: hypothetical protein ABL974_16640 [Prosthecobacter sp.]